MCLSRTSPINIGIVCLTVPGLELNTLARVLQLPIPADEEVCSRQTHRFSGTKIRGLLQSLDLEVGGDQADLARLPELLCCRTATRISESTFRICMHDHNPMTGHGEAQIQASCQTSCMKIRSVTAFGMMLGTSKTASHGMRGRERMHTFCLRLVISGSSPLRLFSA